MAPYYRNYGDWFDNGPGSESWKREMNRERGLTKAQKELFWQILNEKQKLWQILNEKQKLEQKECWQTRPESWSKLPTQKAVKNYKKKYTLPEELFDI
jgi:hypothetical protein